MVLQYTEQSEGSVLNAKRSQNLNGIRTLLRAVSLQWVGYNAIDMIEDIIQKQIDALIKKREDQVLEKLASMGFTFSDEYEKRAFAKDRLTIVTHSDRPHEKHLFVDGKIPVCWWSDEPNFTVNGNTFTMTLGSPSNNDNTTNSDGPDANF